jgi:cell division septal protein FtsQ
MARTLPFIFFSNCVFLCIFICVVLCIVVCECVLPPGDNPIAVNNNNNNNNESKEDAVQDVQQKYEEP